MSPTDQTFRKSTYFRK